MGSRLESKSNEVRKRIESHTFESEDGEEYEPSKFGGFADYFRRKKIKLQNLDAELRSSSADKPPIFRGVVVHVNGYTTPSLNDLHHLIVTHGGGFLQYLDGKTMVTHIIASGLTPKKKVEFKRYRIVKPAWVLESVKAGRLLPWDDFRLVDEGLGQKVLGFDNGRVISQTNNNQRGYREQTDASWYTSQFKNHVDAGQSIPELGDSEMRDTPDSVKNSALAAPESDEPAETNINHYSPALMIEDNQAGALARANVEGPTVEIFPTPQDKSPSYADASDLEKTGPETPKSTTSLPRGNAIATAAEQSPRTGNQKSADVNQAPVKAQMTAEEHNAELLSDPRMWKSSAMNPDFLKQFYQESRLHHLSTWKAELKAQLQAMAQEKTSSQKARQKRIPGARRYILHVDFDSFFAAVSLQKHPEYIGKPAVVAHGTGPGSEIASCNYPARSLGVRNGMWMRSALQLCPDLKTLPYDFKAYEEASRYFYDAILAVDAIVQSVSIDEALVDISARCIEAGGSDGKAVSEGSIYREQEKADQIARGLRDQIRQSTGCEVSVGIGGNVLLARVALRKAKPAGQHQIKPDEVLDFLAPLKVQDLPGVAYSIGGKLEDIGVKLVKDVRELTKERLINTLGPKTGEKLYEYSRGIDRAEVGDQVVRKSVSAEVNWGIRFVTQEQAEEFVQSLSDELNKRLLDAAVKGRQLTVKIMKRAVDAPLDPPKHLGHGKCDTFNRSVLLGVATNAPDVLGKEAISMLRGFGFSPGELRGLGVQMTKLEPLKPSQSNAVDSSQRRLQFKVPTPNSKKNEEKPDPIEDIDSPRKGFKPSTTVIPPINDPSEPEFGKPLNIMGSQFVMPTQLDHEVLAELPEDIRANLVPKTKPPVPRLARKSPFDTSNKSRSHSPASKMEMPSKSQLDPDTLAALPEDVRTEVLSFYSNDDREGGEARPNLGQSTRNPVPMTTKPGKKEPTTPTKKKGTRVSNRKTASKAGPLNPTLTQSNFLNFSTGRTAQDSDYTDEEDDISPDFLAALPPDIRQEVLDNQRRARLKRKGGLDLGSRMKRQTPPLTKEPASQRRLRLPPEPERPTFTGKKLSTLPQLREAISAWFEEFNKDGPYDEDVEALVKYLKRVILEERDMDKAVAVVKWVNWLFDDANDEVKKAWLEGLHTIQDGVQSAVQERGLGTVEFG